LAAQKEKQEAVVACPRQGVQKEAGSRVNTTGTEEKP